MTFGIENCAMRIMKSKKRKATKRIELPNQEISTDGKKENYKYLAILETDTLKQTKMKEKKRKQEKSTLKKQSKKLLETKHYSKNLIKEIKTKEILPVR